jgi:hypothetical protein
MDEPAKLLDIYNDEKLSPYTKDKYYQLLTHEGLDEYQLIPTGLKIVKIIGEKRYGWEEFVIPKNDEIGIELLDDLGNYRKNGFVVKFMQSVFPLTDKKYYELLSSDGLKGYNLIPTSLILVKREEYTETFNSEDEVKTFLENNKKSIKVYDGENVNHMYNLMSLDDGWEGFRLEKADDGTHTLHYYSKGKGFDDANGILLLDQTKDFNRAVDIYGGKRKSRRNNKHKSRKARKMKTRKSRKTGRSRRRRR